MDKSKAKEKTKYIHKLDVEPRMRYTSKLGHLNGFDPYDSLESVRTLDVNQLLPLAFGDILTYLVYGVSAYTLDQFKCYKSLEAHNQFTNGWVHDLKICRPESSDNTVVKAKVLHSMRLSEKPLHPWVIINNTLGTVVAAHCDCMAGLAETCTHVGAVLFKIEAVVRLREKPTVTGLPAYWMIPSAVSKVGPEVGYRIDFTSAAAKKKQLDQAINNGESSPACLRTSASRTKTTPHPTSAEMQAFLASIHGTGDKPAVLSVLPKYCEQYRDPVEPVIMPKSLRSLRTSQHDGMAEADLIAHCETLFHDHRVQISKEEGKKIELETKGQHNTPAWFAARAGRITASQAYNVCRFDLEKPAMSTVNGVCYPRSNKVNTPAVKWGLQHELEAVDTYVKKQKREHFLFSYEKSGFIINSAIPYMGASPDGIIHCECCGRGCIEVKCPYKHRNSAIIDACTDKDFCLIYNNGQFSLKTGHQYYYQIQCQLMASDAEYCDFFMWTTVDSVKIRVVPDIEVIKQCKEKAQLFFMRVVLPELVAKHYSKRSVASSPGPSSEQAGRQKRKPLCISPEKNAPPSKTKTSKRTKKTEAKLVSL